MPPKRATAALRTAINLALEDLSRVDTLALQFGDTRSGIIKRCIECYWLLNLNGWRVVEKPAVKLTDKIE